jgi:hypothetical protein
MVTGPIPEPLFMHKAGRLPVFLVQLGSDLSVRVSKRV